jgi:hypothetical protein
MPGGMMGMLRANVPALYVYGGTILPGKYKGQDLNIVSVFEAVGQFNNNLIDEKTLKGVECSACPGPGSCGGMYTANTMASAIECLGMSLPGSSSFPAETAEKVTECAEAGKAVVQALRLGLRPRDIVKKKNFENAIALVMVLGGSTNAVLHLIAMADAFGVKLGLEDFVRIAKKVPHLADLNVLARRGAKDERVMARSLGVAVVAKRAARAVVDGHRRRALGLHDDRRGAHMVEFRDEVVARCHARNGARHPHFVQAVEPRAVALRCDVLADRNVAVHDAEFCGLPRELRDLRAERIDRGVRNQVAGRFVGVHVRTFHTSMSVTQNDRRTPSTIAT